MGALAWIWALQIDPDRLPEPWSAPARFLPLAAFGLTAYALWRARESRRRPVSPADLQAPIPRAMQRMIASDPASALGQLLPNGWTLTPTEEVFGDQMLILDTGRRRYAIRLHQQHVSLYGDKDAIFEHHRRVLAWLLKWSREQECREAIWWLSRENHDVRLRPNLQVIGGQPQQLIAAIQQAEAVPSPKPAAPARKAARAPSDRSSGPRVTLNRDAVRETLDELRERLPHGWRLVDQVTLSEDFTLHATLLTADDLPIALQVFAPDLTHDLAPRLTSRLEQIAQRSGFLTLGWSAGEASEVAAQGDTLMVFGPLDTLLGAAQDLAALRLGDAA